MSWKLPNDTEEGLGHSYLWLLRKDHAFHECGVTHDRAYEKFEGDQRKLKNSDLAFKVCCLKIAEEKNSKWLKFQAYLFYFIVTLFRVAFR